MICATGIWSRKVWMCRDARAIRSWASILTICYVDLNYELPRASRHIQTFWDRIPVAQSMLDDCLCREGNQPIDFPLFIMEIWLKMSTFDERFRCSRVKKILAALTRCIVWGGTSEHRETRFTTMPLLHRSGGVRGKWSNWSLSVLVLLLHRVDSHRSDNTWFAACFGRERGSPPRPWLSSDSRL